jgi:hypothetical protein
MDVAKKERWKQRDARRKQKRRAKAIRSARIVMYPVPDRRGNLGEYVTWTIPHARSTASAETIARYNATIASPEYKHALAATRSRGELETVMRLYGTLNPPR